METNPNLKILEIAELLQYRLEKISADSPWAHQASGVRASIAKILSREGIPLSYSSSQNLEKLLELGFEILENAAGEIPDGSII